MLWKAIRKMTKYAAIEYLQAIITESQSLAREACIGCQIL